MATPGGLSERAASSVNAWLVGVPASGLIDTGPMVALIDRDDRWHRACVDALDALRLPLLTSTAVLTEAFHLLGDSARERAALWTFLRSGAVRVGEISDADLPVLDALMTKYANRAIDFADATLVHLAERGSHRHLHDRSR